MITLGLDLGTSGIKLLPLDDDTTHGPEDLWRPSKCCLDEFAAHFPRALDIVRGISLSGQMHGATQPVNEKLLERGPIRLHVQAHYPGCDAPRSRAILSDDCSLEALARETETHGIEPQPRCAKQERLEHLINGYF